MQYVTLDTNAWIYLANGTEPANGLEFLRKEIDEKTITLLIPSIVIDEWYANKDVAVRASVAKKFEEMNGGLQTILKLFGVRNIVEIQSFFSFAEEFWADESGQDKFRQIAHDFKKGRSAIEKAVANNIDLVEKLFNHPSSRIMQITKEVMLKSGRFAIDKKAPFLKKNSFADAVILFSFIEYIEKNYILNAVFVTYNTDDFCQKREGKFSLHPDLVPEFQRSYSVFYNASGEAISNINSNITTELLESIREVIIEDGMDEAVEEVSSEECQRCYHEIDFQTVDLDDDRETKSNNQFEFDFVKSLEIVRSSMSFNRLIIGNCSYCDTDYFVCASCGFLNIVEDDDYDVRKECNGVGCYLPYYISSEYGYWDYVRGKKIDKYSILAAKKNCQQCGDEILNDGSDNNICASCEDEYYYGGSMGIY